MNKPAITEAQEILRELAAYDPRLPPITVDGIYDKRTAQAIRIFQSLYGLEPTGEVDSETWNELQDSLRTAQGITPIALEVFTSPGFLVYPNTESEKIRIVQNILNTLSEYYENIRAVTVNGIYDEQTVSGIRQIQTLHRLEENGILDAATWNVLATLYNNRAEFVKR